MINGNINLKTVLLIAATLSAVSCAFYGEEYALTTIAENGWKSGRAISGVTSPYPYVIYECDRFYISTSDIPVIEKSYSAGPVLPVIPVGGEHSFEKNKLTIRLTIKGDVASLEEELKALHVKVTMGDQTYEPMEGKRNFYRYDSVSRERIGTRQYVGTGSYESTFMFPVKIGGVKEFELSIDSTKAGCNVTPVRFVFQGGKYYRPYLFPGK